MNFSFNLIDQPWIPCVKPDGALIEYSLIELLRDAHRLRAICCETPLMSTAIMPLTLAVLHRVFGPETQRGWEELWGLGAFPMEQLTTYFEKWYERFDLFHPERPFYQARDDRVKPKSIIHIIHSIGNTGTLFTHARDDRGLRLSPAIVARHLIAAQSFRTAGLSGLDEKFTDSPLTRGVLFWAEGETIFETLMLNLLSYPQERVMQHTPQDAPTWELDDPFQKRMYPFGYLDYLTWSSKRIWLIPEQEGDEVVVRMMTIAPGLNLDASVKSPQKRYVRRENKKGEISWPFLYFNPDKALWRDYHSLLALGQDDVRPPAVVEWLADLALDGVIDDRQSTQITATGMLADQAKPIFYRQEPMPLPPALLIDDDETRHKRAIIDEAIKQAEDVAYKLRNGLNILADHVLMRGGDAKPDSNDRKKLVQQWDVLTFYWSCLETNFWDFIHQLLENPDEAATAWRKLLKGTAKDTLAEAARMAGSSPWALKGQVIAERVLRSNLKKILNIL